MCIYLWITESRYIYKQVLKLSSSPVTNLWYFCNFSNFVGPTIGRWSSVSGDAWSNLGAIASELVTLVVLLISRRHWYLDAWSTFSANLFEENIVSAIYFMQINKLFNIFWHVYSLQPQLTDYSCIPSLLWFAFLPARPITQLTNVVIIVYSWFIEIDKTLESNYEMCVVPLVIESM